LIRRLFVVVCYHLLNDLDLALKRVLLLYLLFGLSLRWLFRTLAAHWGFLFFFFC
jgi:hypothetical protein